MLLKLRAAGENFGILMRKNLFFTQKYHENVFFSACGGHLIIINNNLQLASHLESTNHLLSAKPLRAESVSVQFARN